MDKKGFTLFTALVSFVLILLSAMIVQTMIKAERDRTEVITNIEEQAEMQAMADLTRAEAIQTFNYSIRKKMEDYFTRPDNTIAIDTQDKNFYEIKESFAKRFFGAGGDGEQFIYDMATTITNSIPQKKFVGPYEITMEFKGEDLTDKKQIQFETLKELFRVSVENGEFFEVVDCQNGNPQNCVGTFYLNLKTSDLDNETYEALPRIKVFNPRTQRVLQESVFQRGNIKLYVPIRLFKAIAEARALALEYNKEEGSLWKENYGLFSPRIHNEIKEMKLGMCDPNYCNPRNNPYIPPKQKNMEKACPSTTDAGSNIITIKCTADLIAKGICSEIGENVASYNSNTRVDSLQQGQVLAELVGQRLCSLAGENISTKEYLDYDPEDDFVLAQDNSYNITCNLGTEKKISINVSTVTRNSVKINFTSNENIDGQKNAHNNSYNANENYGSSTSNCPMTSSLNSWGNQGVGIENGKIVKRTIEDKECSGSGFGFPQGQQPNYATCSEVTKIQIKVPFKETNQKYIIDKTTEPIYVVELINNNFFTGNASQIAFHQNKEFAIDSSTCGLGNSAVNNTCNPNDWTCDSIMKYDIFEGATYGCQTP